MQGGLGLGVRLHGLGGGGDEEGELALLRLQQDAVRDADEELLDGARVQLLLVELRDEETLVLAAVQPRLIKGEGYGRVRG